MKIDPEFKSFIPPLAADERARLESSIVAAGCATDPIIAWHTDEGPVVVDGHNRFEICTARGLPFKVEVRSFADREAVKAWMFEHQIARRNLSPDQVTVLAAERGMPRNVRTMPAWHKAQDIRGTKHAASVLSGGLSLVAAWNDWARAHGKLKPRMPRTTQAPERTVEVITAETRAKAQASAARADAKAVASRLAALEDELAFMHAAPCAPPVIATSTRPKSGKRVATPCFVLSDLHFGETVTLEETLGANAYNLEIAAARTSKCFDNMLWLRDDMARTQTCDDTVIFLNGDIVSGDIHDELRETNDGGLRDQCDAAFRALHPGIKAFADATPGVLHVVCIGGNHGRLTHKQQIKNGQQHSAEHIGVYDPLRRTIGDMGGKIAWHIPPAERYIVDVHGHKVSAQHGTMIRSAGGIGGVLVPMVRWVTRDNSADYYVFGHFHEADAFGKIIKNGATIGSSAYTRWLGIEDRPPEQVGFVLDAVRGLRRFERVSVT